MLGLSPADSFNPQPMSTAKRVTALIVIFVFATIAWMILGATIFQRTYDQSGSLRPRVSSSWGAQQTQSAPTAAWERFTQEREQTEDDRGNIKTKLVNVRHTGTLPLESTRAKAVIDLEHRQKGLLWYSTYKVDFGGEYAFRN